MEFAQALKSADRDELANVAANAAMCHEITMLVGTHGLDAEVKEVLSQARDKLSVIRESVKKREVWDNAPEVVSDGISKAKPRSFKIGEVADKKNDNVNFRGVHHIASDEVAVATDGRAMVVCKDDYDAAHGGKMVGTKGEESDGWDVPYKKLIKRSGAPSATVPLSDDVVVEAGRLAGGLKKNAMQLL